MTQILKTILPALAATALLTACDDIDKPEDRYEYMGSTTAERTVLLEDFTGQECRNCPDAHEVIEGLEALYGDNIIAVSIHGGSFGVPVSESVLPGYVCLASDEGIEYNNRQNLTSWPAGMINRTGGIVNYDKWSDVVREAIQKPATADIDLTASLGNDGNITITTTTDPKDTFDASLQLWVVESGIVAFQQKGREWLTDYVHNNVLRAAVNGIDGQAAHYTKGVSNVTEHSIAVRHTDTEQWDTANLAIVAFIYNSEQGVLQAARAKVMPLPATYDEPQDPAAD